MSESSAEYLIALVVILAVTVLPLAIWDGLKAIGRRILRWAEDRVARDVAAALRQPLDRQPSSLDVTADRHEAYPMHVWRTK